MRFFPITWFRLTPRPNAEVRAQIPLAVKALSAAVRELMVMEEQKDAGGEDHSDDSEGEEIQDEMKALMVSWSLTSFISRIRKIGQGANW